MIKCFRLVTSEGSQEGAADGLSVQPQLVGDDDKDDGVFGMLSFPCNGDNGIVGLVISCQR
jgi:hypothetical protein